MAAHAPRVTNITVTNITVSDDAELVTLTLEHVHTMSCISGYYNLKGCTN